MALPGARSAPAALAAMALALLAAGCAAPRGPSAMAPTGQSSFADYAHETRAWLAQRRDFQTGSVADELAWNAPREWRPAGPAMRGVLPVHGLGDSPWSFADIGPVLAAQGFLAREVPMLYVGGFSTGANLALEYALEHRSVQGLLLFSPALKSSVPGDWLLPWLARATTWVRPPASEPAQQSALRYLNVPTDAFAQYYRSSVAVRAKIARTHFDRPAVLVPAEHDSVVDVRLTYNPWFDWQAGVIGDVMGGSD